MKILSCRERNRLSAKRTGKEQVVHSLPDASLFLHVCLSYALKSPSDGPSWHQSANIRVDSTHNVLFSHLLVPQNKQTAGVKECIPPHTCQKSLACCLLSSPCPINCGNCAAWIHTALFLHLLHSLSVLEETYFFHLFLLLDFFLSISSKRDCKP